MTIDALLVILVGVIATTYIPSIILFLWKYVIFPVIRIFSFPVIRWNKIHKKIKPVKFMDITNPRIEYLLHWYVYIRYGTYYQSEKEIRQERSELESLRTRWEQNG